VVTGRLTPTDDATSTYAQLAEAGPDIVFAPLPPRRLLTLWDAGTDSANRLRTTRLTTASSIDAEFLADDRAQDHYIAQVQVDLTEGASAVTGMSAAIALERIAVPLGRDQADIASVWRNTYDAVTLLLSALNDASLIDASDRSLVIGRKDLRATLRTTGFEGMSGTVRCDEFGDCAGTKGQIRLHSDPTLRSLDDLEIEFDWSE
jgi:ABC-type branched-subunit amino acid transport system substrate-binding protein